MESGHCALCLKSRPLAGSHIIPNAYFRAMKRQNSGRLVSFDSLPNSNVRLSNESWKEPMLCAECEEIFSKLETRCIRSLRQAARAVEVHSRHGACLPNYDHKVFSRFLMSLLWRAAVSKQEPFSSVSIEPKVVSGIQGHLLLDTMPVHSFVRCQIKKIVDNSERIKASKYEGIAASPSATVQGNTVVFTFIFAGYLVKYYLPSLPAKIRGQLGLVKNTPKLFVPTIDMTSVPELMKLLVFGYAKHKAGMTELKT
jgi:hypothetical protein